MNDDTIDRALRDEPEIMPSLGFSHRVMRSVRHEAAYRQAIPFPWKIFAAGLGVSVAMILVGTIIGAPPQAALPELPEHLVQALAALATTLTGTLGLAWWSVRFARLR